MMSISSVFFKPAICDIRTWESKRVPRLGGTRFLVPLSEWLTTAPAKAPHQGHEHRKQPEQGEEDGPRHTEAESDPALFYLAGADGPHGIKYEVKKDRGKKPYERGMPDRY